MRYLIILDFTLFLSLLFYRTILAALHFNYNLNRDSKTDGQGRPVLYVTYPKFKEGEATVREAKVSANYGSCSLRSKRFQSSYCAKVRAGAKKRLKGEGEGRRGNACLQTPQFWKTPLDISRFGSFVN